MGREEEAMKILHQSKVRREKSDLLYRQKIWITPEESLSTYLSPFPPSSTSARVGLKNSPAS